MSKQAKSHLSLFIVNLIYGVNFLIAKGLMPDLIGPSGFIIVRVLGATSLFWLIWAIWIKEPIKDWQDLKLIIICAVFGVATNQLLFFNGLCITSPVNASLIMVSSPILVLIISAILIKERITGLKLAGVIVGALGAALLIILRDKGNTQSSLAGDLMVFFNGLSYAVYLVLVRPLMKKYQPFTVISYVFLAGTLMVIPFGWSQFWEIEWAQFTFQQSLGVAFVVLFVTFLAYLLNTFALKYVTASVSSVYIYIQPFVATLFMYVLYRFGIGQPADLTLNKVFCGLLIFVGVFLVSRPQKKQLKDL